MTYWNDKLAQLVKHMYTLAISGNLLSPKWSGDILIWEEQKVNFG